MATNLSLLYLSSLTLEKKRISITKNLVPESGIQTFLFYDVAGLITDQFTDICVLENITLTNFSLN